MPNEIKVYASKAFVRFGKSNRINEQTLLDAVDRAESGLVDANLGGDVIKQRVARQGEGRSGGFRTIILYLAGSRAVFVHGFAKSERENITAEELEGFRLLANEILAFSEEKMAQSVESGALVEIKRDSEDGEANEG